MDIGWTVLAVVATAALWSIARRIGDLVWVLRDIYSVLYNSRKMLIVVTLAVFSGCDSGPAPAVVKLMIDNYTTVHEYSTVEGTAFFAGGRMYTATHNIVGSASGSRYTTRGDLAYVQVPETNRKLLEATSEPSVGSSAVCLGYPGGSDKLKRVYGVITAPGYVTGTVVRGMSGGPVICGGRVVGVISRYYPELGITQYEPLTHHTGGE